MDINATLLGEMLSFGVGYDEIHLATFTPSDAGTSAKNS
jgi:hypothetical protein